MLDFAIFATAAIGIAYTAISFCLHAIKWTERYVPQPIAVQTKRVSEGVVREEQLTDEIIHATISAIAFDREDISCPMPDIDLWARFSPLEELQQVARACGLEPGKYSADILDAIEARCFEWGCA